MTSEPKPADLERGESLPSVEPPTAGFILQLFLIPLLIVSIVIALWLLFSWLAHAGQNDPEIVLRDLRRMGSNSFQRAHELASILQEQSEQGEKLRKDPAFAKQVGDVLMQDIEAFPGEITPSRGKLRLFLCGALAEFEIPEAADPLVKTLRHTGSETEATTATAKVNATEPTAEVESQANNVQVRMAAAESLAKLAARQGSEQIRAVPEVIPALIEFSRRDSRTDEADAASAAEVLQRDSRMKSGYRPYAELRSVCAYALGVIGGTEALDRLQQMAENDPYPSARYNAATGLARYGDERVTETLLDMLDPENKAPAENEWHRTEKEQAVVNVLKAGLQATLRLVQTNPQADVSKLRPAVERLANEDLSKIHFQDEAGKDEISFSSASQRLIRLSAAETLRLMDEVIANRKQAAPTAP